jgi:3-hydroxyisobutyrate dehydrogenase-like beta-hydroxyacid dehydrogenase
MTEVTVIGLGPMGQALASALLAAGFPTTVWNRTKAKAEALQRDGAKRAETPGDAIAGSDVTLINVVDNDAVDAIVATAGDAVAGRSIVGLASDTPDRARSTAAIVEGLGGRYLDGAIMTPVSTIGTSSASILFAGPRDIYDVHRDVFDALATTGWLGDDYGRAAAYDVTLLDLFWTSIAGFVHAAALARAEGIALSDWLPHAQGMAGILPPLFTDFTERIEHDRHDHASSTLSSIRTSLDHLISASGTRGLDAVALRAFRGDVDRAISNGHGDDEVSRLAVDLAS